MIRRLVVAWVLMARVANADELKLEDALAQARQTNKPLVLEFRADWCGPCLVFEREVLPRREVVDELQKIIFVRYDLESPIGRSVSERYSATAVPVFIVLGSDGTELHRWVGMPRDADQAAERFLMFLGLAEDSHVSLDTLEGLVRQDPNNVPARLRLARAYTATHDVEKAAAQYRALVEIPGVSRAVAANATLELQEVVAIEARIRAAIQASIALLERFSDQPLATKRLAIIVASKRMPADEVRLLIADHLLRVPEAGLANAVRLALYAGALSEARAAVDKWRARKPAAAEVIASETEVELYAGNFARAGELVSTLCASETSAFACMMLRPSVIARARYTPGVQQLVDEALAFINRLEQPNGDSETIADIGLLAISDPTFANGIALALTRAAAACADDAGPTASAAVLIAFDRAGRRSRIKTLAAGPGENLPACVTRALSEQRLPRAPDNFPRSLHLHFPIKGAASSWRAAHGVAGAALYVADRQGAIPMQSIGVAGQLHLDHYLLPSGVRTVGAAEGQLGRGGDSTMYAIRGWAGFGFGDRFMPLSLLAGFGRSAFGPRAARANEYLLELRVQFPVHKAFVHLFVRSVTLELSDPPPMTLPRGDELEFGMSVSFPIRRMRFLVGVTGEDRTAGTSALLTVGVPLGSGI